MGDGSSAVGGAVGMLSSLTSVVQSTVSRKNLCTSSLCTRLDVISHFKENGHNEEKSCLSIVHKIPHSVSHMVLIDLIINTVLSLRGVRGYMCHPH